VQEAGGSDLTYLLFGVRVVPTLSRLAVALSSECILRTLKYHLPAPWNVHCAMEMLRCWLGLALETGDDQTVMASISAIPNGRYDGVEEQATPTNPTRYPSKIET